MARIACAYLSENMANAMRHRTNDMWLFRRGALAWRGHFARTDGSSNAKQHIAASSQIRQASDMRRDGSVSTAPKGLASREVHPDAIRSTTTRASLPGSHPEAG